MSVRFCGIECAFKRGKTSSTAPGCQRGELKNGGPSGSPEHESRPWEVGYWVVPKRIGGMGVTHEMCS